MALGCSVLSTVFGEDLEGPLLVSGSNCTLRACLGKLSSQCRNQQRPVISQSWRLEVQGQMWVSRLAPLKLGRAGSVSGHSCWLLFVSWAPVLPFHRDLGHTGLGLTPVIGLYFDGIFKTLFFTCGLILNNPLLEHILFPLMAWGLELCFRWRPPHPRGIITLPRWSPVQILHGHCLYFCYTAVSFHKDLKRFQRIHTHVQTHT